MPYRVLTILLLLFTSYFTFAQTQKKNFTNCNSLVRELDSVRNSMHDMVNIFAEDVILEDHIGIEYSSNYSICGQPGVIERLADRTIFTFTYDNENYIGSGDDFQRRFELFFNELRLLLTKTHYPTFRFLGADETSYEFLEHGKDAMNSNKMMTLLLSKRPGFLKVALSFVNKNTAKKAF